jgi:alanine dehydrogenase
MNIGILKEDFRKESRVALTPAGVQTLVEQGNTVYIEKDAGMMSRFFNEDYEQVGGKIIYSSEEVIGRSEIVVKIYPYTEEELELIDSSKITFSFLHLEIAGRKIIELIQNKKLTSFSYELIEDTEGNLPIQEVSSEIAGRMAIPIAQRCLCSGMDGRGILLGGIPGVPPAAVVILGAGMVGRTAAKSALAMGAHVSVLDNDVERLRRISDMYPSITTAIANQFNLERGVKFSDVFITAVLLRGARAPHLITEEMVKTMKKGAVIIDFSIDQGGVVETSRPTTLNDPTFVKHGVVHYCVPNIPSAVARTATYGLTNAFMPYLSAITKYGLEDALENMPGLSKGLCTLKGKLIKDSLKLLYNL